MNQIQTHLEQIVAIYKNFQNPEIKYFGVADLILHYGKQYTNIINHNKYGPKKQCYYNSFKLATTCDLIYCEGFAINKAVNYFPFEHAWCIDHEDNVIDPTWDDGIDYFGIAFSTNFVVELALKTGCAGVLGELNDLKMILKNGFNQSDLHSKNPIG